MKIIITEICALLAAVLIASIFGSWHPRMPATVDVNGIRWQVRQVDEIGVAGSGIVGHTDCATREIDIARATDQLRPQQVLMHELSHALVCGDVVNDFDVDNMYFNSSGNEEHEGIYRYAAMWAAMLQRNPRLAAYLGQ